jgi:hypothetical protein
MVQALAPHTPTHPRSISVGGGEGPADAGALAPDGARTPRGVGGASDAAVPKEAVPKHGDRAPALYKRLLALPWRHKPAKTVPLTKRESRTRVEGGEGERQGQAEDHGRAG